MSSFWRWMLVLMTLVFVTGCDYEEIRREVGYKGRARLNPWLAAERFSRELGYDVKALSSWKNPDWDSSVFFVPAEILNNRSFVEKMGSWVRDGGHLVLLCDYSQQEWNDWSEFSRPDTRIEEPLVDFLGNVGIGISETAADEASVMAVDFRGEAFKIDAGSKTRVKSGDGEESVFASRRYGEGMLSVVTDARIFRNRKIDQEDHAAFLHALIDGSDYEGNVVFLKGSGISIWNMLLRHLWPLLVAMGVMLVFWLWKSLARFGPLEAAAAPSPLRGYDHHLEALGDFQWRLDKCSALLAPLREQIVEAGQRLAMKSGRRDADFFAFLAERAGLPRERVVRALSEAAPADSAVMVTTTSDLQTLIRSLGGAT